MLGELRHQRTAKLQRVGVGGFRYFVDEALGIDAVLIRVDPAPRADWYVGVAHRVLDQQVRHRVAKLRVASGRPEILQLPIILAFFDQRRVDEGVSRQTNTYLTGCAARRCRLTGLAKKQITAGTPG